jgi:formylglycine-generating enzyme required for sulfatase activity
VYSVTVSGVEVDWAALLYGAIPPANDNDWNAATRDTTKNGYRLPTEMEWMWAAMGADRTSQPNTTGYSKTYAGSVEAGTANLGNYAWYYDNSDSKTHEVGKKAANELGLKDMSGNVWEWCWDWYNSYPAGERTDYAGAASGSYRVHRGGSWGNNASNYTVAVRGYGNPNGWDLSIGFRVVCP